MKNLLVFSTALLLAACDAGYADVKNKFYLPPELSDCSVYKLMEDSSGLRYTVIRCPSSSVTTATNGKDGKTVTVVDENK